VEAIIGYTFGLLVGGILLVSFLGYGDLSDFLRKIRQHREARRRERQQQETQESGDPEPPNQGEGSAQAYARHPKATEENLEQLNRRHLIRSKLLYQVVLAGKSNTTAECIRTNVIGPKSDDPDDATIASEGSDDDDNSVIGSDETKPLSGKKPAAKKESSNSASFFFPLRQILSFRSIKEEECSICLECFEPCQTICVAKNGCCNHTFHEECIESWLMEHDHCPNCRANMME